MRIAPALAPGGALVPKCPFFAEPAHDDLSRVVRSTLRPLPKLDLDRYQREAADLIGEMKKEADQFIAKAREEMAAAELAEDDET